MRTMKSEGVLCGICKNLAATPVTYLDLTLVATMDFANTCDVGFRKAGAADVVSEGRGSTVGADQVRNANVGNWWLLLSPASLS